jgi:hypothetical protein
MEINKIIESLYWTELRMPLFYKSDYGLRFDTRTLGLEIGTLQYFDTAVERAITLFLDLFEDTEILTMVIHSSGYADEIDFNSWSLSEEISECIDFTDAEVFSELIKYINDPEDDEMMTVRTIVKVRKKKVDYYEIIKRICRQDIGRTPCIDDEMFILNDDLSIAYNFFDDRGVDISARNSELLQEIYNLRREWLYDYDDKQHVIKL